MPEHYAGGDQHELSAAGRPSFNKYYKLSAAVMTGIALRFGSPWLMSRQIASSCFRI